MRHHQRHLASSPTRLLLLLAVALLVAAAVVTAPAAAAAPTSTTLTVTAQRTSVNWGAKAVLNGVLRTTEAPARPVDGQQVLVQYATSPTALWTTAATVSNTAAPYTSGAYTHSWTASRNYYWRMVFPGQPSVYNSATSNVVKVSVKPLVGKPSCPSTIQAKKKFTVSGTLKPRFAAGTKTVKVRAQRYAGGKWRTYKTWTAKNANFKTYTKYSVKISIAKKGKYRFYATSAGTSTLSAGRSPYSRSMKVK